MPSSDVDYYRQRAITERQLAGDAERADVAAIHEELARQYQPRGEARAFRVRVRLQSLG